MAEENKQAITEERFSALLNGKGSAGAKVLRVPQDCSLEDIFAAASDTLGVGPLAKVFLKSGAEVCSRADLRDNDTLVFASENEEFKAAGVLQSLASTAFSISGDLYASYVPKVVEAFPSVARPIAKVEELAGVVQPRVAEVGVPALQWADSKIQGVYNRMQSETDRFLGSDLGAKTQAVLLTRYQPVESFLKNAFESWQGLGARLHADQLSFSAFAAEMKAKMGAAWSERMVSPARAFYDAAVDESANMLEGKEGETRVEALVSNIKTRLGPAWEKTVTLAQEKAPSMLPARIRDFAATFYQAAVESFISLHLTAQQGQVSVQEFIAGVRVKLGGLWSEGLSPITAQVFEMFKQQEVAPHSAGEIQREALPEAPPEADLKAAAPHTEGDP